VNLALLQQKWCVRDEAEANFKKAQSLDPNSSIPRMYLGAFYENHKRPDDARKEFEAAIQLEPKNPAPRTALAAVYFAQGDIDQAEKVLTDAKAQMPDDPAGYRMLGDFYIARGESAKALTEFSSLVASHPGSCRQETYVQLLILSHKLDEAATVNDSILKAAPGQRRPGASARCRCWGKNRMTPSSHFRMRSKTRPTTRPATCSWASRTS
jgi:predicted Zn-dependent protease